MAMSLIPLTEIFARAARDARVRTVAVCVVALAVVLVGFRLAFGSNVFIQTEEARKCATDLASATVRVELGGVAMQKCETALSLCSRSQQ